MNKSSSRPVGATTYKETAFGILPRNKLLELEIEGIKRGLEFIHSSINRGDLIISTEFVCDLHKISFGWIFPEWAGKFRTIQVKYSDKEAPPYFQLPELIHNLCEDLKARLKLLPAQDDANYISEVIRLIAWFQHRFVFIHPFQDYNGRTARMITIAILLILSLPPLELEVDSPDDRHRYLLSMQQADEGDYSLLEDLLSKALSESLDKVLKAG